MSTISFASLCCLLCELLWLLSYYVTLVIVVYNFLYSCKLLFVFLSTIFSILLVNFCLSFLVTLHYATFGFLCLIFLKFHCHLHFYFYFFVFDFIEGLSLWLSFFSFFWCRLHLSFIIIILYLFIFIILFISGNKHEGSKCNLQRIALCGIIFFSLFTFHLFHSCKVVLFSCVLFYIFFWL